MSLNVNEYLFYSWCFLKTFFVLKSINVSSFLPKRLQKLNTFSMLPPTQVTLTRHAELGIKSAPLCSCPADSHLWWWPPRGGWCWCGRTGPGFPPRTGRCAAVSPSSRSAASWWPPAALAYWAASGSRGTPHRNHLQGLKTRGRKGLNKLITFLTITGLRIHYIYKVKLQANQIEKIITGKHEVSCTRSQRSCMSMLLAS